MHHLVVVSDNTVESSRTVDFSHHDINSALQTTLAFDKLIAIFSSKINNLIPHSGYSYSHEMLGLDISHGVISKYACSYVLKTENNYLGELKLMRNHKFMPTELDVLEKLLCSLHFPLKNATLYHQALKMAETDQLTQTLNRVSFNGTVKRSMKLAKTKNTHLSIIFLDIDHFKTINDEHGHDCGDNTLIAVATLIKNNLRKNDTIFRFGGEEFVILVNDMDISNAEVLAHRIRSSIEQNTLVYDMKPIKVTASLGVSSLRSEDSFDTFVKRADHAMYEAKRNGRNQVVLT